MKAWRRWWRFNLVGAVGMAVQLCLLALMGRWAKEHVLPATAMAIEATLLHNFAWHVRYTWADRYEASTGDLQALRKRLLTFHLSNGLVSMTGNLALMWVLVRGAGLPLLVANLVAIVGCSLVNFWLGDRWIFGSNVGVSTTYVDRKGTDCGRAMG